MQKLPSWEWKDLEDFKTLTDPTSAPYIIQVAPSPVLRSLLASFAPNPPPYSLLSAAHLAPYERILGDLAGLGTTTAERHREYLRHLELNRYFQWLSAEPRFKQALKAFHAKARRNGPPGYKREWAEFYFLNACEMVGVFQPAIAGKTKPKYPTRRQVEARIATTKKLLFSMTQGDPPEPYFDHLKAEQLLKEMIAKLTEALRHGYERPKSTGNAWGRELVQMLTHRFLRDFDDASPTIIRNLAEAAGYSVDETSIEKQIKTIRAKVVAERKRAAAVSKVANALVALR
jgi:hypothetical protein